MNDVVALARAVLDNRTVRADDQANARELARGVLRLAALISENRDEQSEWDLDPAIGEAWRAAT